MPTLHIYELRFRAGLHVGRHGIGQEAALAHVPADTLFAALVAIRAQMRAGAGAWAGRFAHDPPFRLTSAFPFAGGVRFFPRPVRPPVAEGVAFGKQWRKIRFVSQGVLEHLLKGRVPAELWPKPPEEKPAEGLTLQGGTLWLTQAEIEKLPEELRTKTKNGKREPLSDEALQRRNVWGQDKVPRVMVDRLTNASQIYHTGRIVFAPGCGLWFGVQGTEGGAFGDLEELLRALGDAGLGAERSVGYGAFTFTRAAPLQLPDANGGGLMMLLSRFYPRDENDAAALTRGDSAYDLVYVAGRVSAPGVADQRRRGVRLAAEGSLLGSRAMGGLAKVTPEVGNFPHEVYRYGLALGVGWGGG
ncbi:MAG: type III-A CRISPR-associated RAMP protein Csm4 [Anaerolineales bacterium]|nr:type III-A CRISPR-associated RAMP protein Csm4 [Anaerolineales bacterium]